MQIELRLYRCPKCNHIWVSRQASDYVLCPRCKRWMKVRPLKKIVINCVEENVEVVVS